MGGDKGVGRADSLLGFGEEFRGGNSGEGTPRGGAEGDGSPPAWPEEAARRAKRVIQSTLFPEFEDFDVVRFVLLIDLPPMVDSLIVIE